MSDRTTFNWKKKERKIFFEQKAREKGISLPKLIDRIMEDLYLKEMERDGVNKHQQH